MSEDTIRYGHAGAPAAAPEDMLQIWWADTDDGPRLHIRYAGVTALVRDPPPRDAGEEGG